MHCDDIVLRGGMGGAAAVVFECLLSADGGLIIKAELTEKLKNQKYHVDKAAKQAKEITDGSRSTAAMICSIGVSPVPPDIMPSRLQETTPPPVRKRPPPRYTWLPHGPESATVAPTRSESRYCDILPPSGKRSIWPPE